MARAETALETDDARLLNRELSWLDYDARVLARAADSALPLLERSRNCAYFSSNLDEFFQVRVAGLMGQRPVCSSAPPTVGPRTRHWRKFESARSS